MNYDELFSDIKEWLKQNNLTAQKYGFNTNDYWRWVVKTSGELCNYYENKPVVINLMIGLWNYLIEVSEK